jgi:hypothetical protein
MKHFLAFGLSAGIFLVGLFSTHCSAVELSIVHQPADGAVRLVLDNSVADIYVDNGDAKLTGIAAGLLADDVQRVTSRKPRVVNDAAQLGRDAVIIGTVGNSALIDRLITDKKIDAADVRGQWETYKLQVVANPITGVDRALVIFGSDRRGTAYGVVTLSKAIGVSPWYWWADVAPTHQDALLISPASVKEGPPSVKYRGIFINDEDWGLEPWAAKYFDPQQGNIGPKTYEKVFELLLRLRLNYIWPAMHACSTEFGKIERNITLADEWGIVAGASHPEAMNRNNVDWPKLNLGEWRYDTNRQAVYNYWEEWAKKRGPYEAVWTVGMRGVHDAPMLGPADMPSKVKILEQAIADQRDLLRKYVNPDIEKVAQIFTPYKEALAQYRAGLKLPEDVTIVWTEDNFGYIRQLSNPREQKRKGGSGVYYHISYLGNFSYVWLNTTPPALIWEEMSKAYDYGADKVWVLNVGDIKPGEIGIDFWSRLGWDINSYHHDTVGNFLTDWAGETFGADYAKPIAAVMEKYYRMGYARKPEAMKPDLFKDNYGETGRRYLDYIKLRGAALDINQSLPKEKRDAFFELVLYPVEMADLTNEVFMCAGKNNELAKSQSTRTNYLASEIDQAMSLINSETDDYNNKLAGGKWRGMMTVRGCTSSYAFKWPTPVRVGDGQPPETNNLPFPLPSQGKEPRSNTESPPRFAETDGYLSIEAEHFTRNIPVNGASWQVIKGLGRDSDSVAVYPTTVATISKPEDIAGNSPQLQYDFTTTTATPSMPVEITTYKIPTRRISDARGLRYAIAIDDEKPRVVDFNEENEGPRWAQNVARNSAIDVSKHTIAAAGKHTLKIWMVDPGVVLEKIVINTGGLKESYLGPPETLAGNAQ